MTDRTDLAVLADETIGYLPRIRALMFEDGQRLERENPGHYKIVGSPAPWNDEAAGLALEIHARVRQHERRLTARLFGRVTYRGSSDQITVELLRRLPDLIAAAGDDQDATAAASDLTSWPRRCRSLLDEARAGEEPLARAPGGLTCPHCDRPLRLKPGWQYDNEPDVWCLRCPGSDGQDISWPPGAWLAVLQHADQAEENAS